LYIRKIAFIFYLLSILFKRKQEEGVAKNIQNFSFPKLKIKNPSQEKELYQE
jgi:hypothetical protein